MSKELMKLVEEAIAYMKDYYMEQVMFGTDRVVGGKEKLKECVDNLKAELEKEKAKNI